jgi:O-acetyl-ADP-ribose deacetylase (regulator of RNase III)
MVAQKGMKTGSSGPPIRYNYLGECLSELAGIAKSIEASIHMPRIGCGLAGGKWDKVEPLIVEHLDGLEVIVYDF